VSRTVGVVDHDERAGARLAELIAAIPDDAWESATPCEGWSVRDLVGHVVAGNVKYQQIAAGGDFEPGAPEVSIGDDPAATYRETLQGMLTAWRVPGSLEREVGLPRGRGRAEVAAWIHLAETLGHGWDLATATGQPAGFDDETVAACLAECRDRIPPERPPVVPFADAVSVEGGPLIDQLAAYLGRSPAPPAG
jgi:uncharacterized protein (TIGR03086 family)